MPADTKKLLSRRAAEIYKWLHKIWEKRENAYLIPRKEHEFPMVEMGKFFL